ncbi:HDOD domain-containing protein [Megalodesulfovibrio gigas]|uniref:Putative metal-dependent hydrolase HDOD n=1 Tax=Megalodesulfovibrio gigas (strain ATCC 19364 / DSM 1382 / NCIMB 9332 / VKM B-1759) TaxID=1121448 RepID=T2GFG5_MEGG1|nr:HDOD domain-containing protein [Megalodesulfovibrio gigas]AGW14924.1 putative metal-dependent hydrolase HDOD [Megalodesulfovibrio gigas DSM 1382 = ATCC 19364]
MTQTRYERGHEFLAFLPTIGQDLPYSMTLLRDLFDMTSDKSLASMPEMARTLGQDQGLTAKVLAMANSAFYGLQSRVSTLPRALALLGVREIRQLVLVLGVQSICSRRTLPHAFDLHAYWKHQLQVAAVCKELGHLARAAGQPALDIDLLYTTGLLHDLGKLLTALHRPQDWDAMEKLRQDEGLPAFAAEDRYWGLEHGVVGAITLNSWNIPQELTEPVNWHHVPELAKEWQPQATILCLADALCHALEQDEAEPAPPAPHVLACLKRLGLELAPAWALARERFHDERLEEMATLLQ